MKLKNVVFILLILGCLVAPVLGAFTGGSANASDLMGAAVDDTVLAGKTVKDASPALGGIAAMAVLLLLLMGSLAAIVVAFIFLVGYIKKHSKD